MLCAISGEAPHVPVASKKSGHVFEKRLIEEYISENGKDPVTGEILAIEDLIDLQTSRIVRPRPPTLTSIPSLLATFQNEWDAVMLETYTLKKHLAQTRQELTTALYQNDAANRVIARLTTERNEAREALSKVTISADAGSNGDAMQIDSTGLPQAFVEVVEATQDKLSKSRRKRPLPEGWATPEEVQSYTVVQTSEPLYPGTSSIAVEKSEQIVIIGTSIYSLSSNRKTFELSISGQVTDSVWCDGLAIISSASGEIKAFSNEGQEVHSFNVHAGEASALAVHASGKILASVGVDKSFVFYDISGGRKLNRVFSDSVFTTAAFHPDGHLFGAGDADGQIKLFYSTTGALAATFDLGGAVQSLAFSENGTWFAAVEKGSSSVVIFDLRKQGPAARVNELETGGRVDAISWDYTGSFLATAGPSGITVQQYTKSSKIWSVPFTNATPSTAIEWGEQAHSIICASKEGEISLLSTK